MKIVNNPFIGTKYIGKEEIKAVNKVLKSKSLFRYHGPNLLNKVEEFEKKLKEKLGIKYSLGVSNGTAALKLALIGLGIGPGDNVLVPAFTFIATANAILSVGAVPKFIDIDESINVNPDKIEENIDKNTKAIIIVHIQGLSCDIYKIKKIAKKNKIYIIEDVAQSFGSKYNDKYLGTFSEVGCYSFQAGKTITCGEGGALVTNNYKIYKKMKMYHDFGGERVGNNYPIWNNGKTFFGENFKMTEIQGAILIEQLKKLEKICKKQRDSYQRVMKKLKLNKFENRYHQKNMSPIYTSLCFIFETKEKCDLFIFRMNEKGITFTKNKEHLISNFDTFKKLTSWHHSSFPYNISNFKKTNLKYTINLINRVAWFNLSAFLNSKELNYINKTIRKYEND